MDPKRTKKKTAPTPLGSPQAVRLARRLRKKDNPAERILWRALRNRALDGLKFRRQHPIGSSIADYFCEEAGLIVEIDGQVHALKRKHDAHRDASMDSHGLKTLRFTVSDVMTNLEGVLTVIQREARKRIDAEDSR